MLCSLILVGLPCALNNSIMTRNYYGHAVAGPTLHVMHKVLRALHPKLNSVAPKKKTHSASISRLNYVIQLVLGPSWPK